MNPLNWYQFGKTALRKHMMRVDLRVYVSDDDSQFSNPNDRSNAIRSIVTAAVAQGLDVLGIVSSDPMLGWEAKQIVKDKQFDLWVLPGQEYNTSDGFSLILYNLNQALSPDLDFATTIQKTHQLEGFVMAIHVTKKQAATINKLVQTVYAPDAVEIYHDGHGGYQDIEVNYPKFITSGAKSADAIQQSQVFTTINRKELEAMKLLPEGAGINFVPRYLSVIHPGNSPVNE